MKLFYIKIGFLDSLEKLDGLVTLSLYSCQATAQGTEKGVDSPDGSGPPSMLPP